MEEFDFITYMEDCATNLKAIGHSDSEKRFFKISGLGQLDELLSSLSKAQFPAIMVHDNLDGNIGDQSVGDNYMDTPYYAFYVITHVEYDNHDQRKVAKETCKSIGEKILARMLRDKKRGRNGLTFLDFRNIPYQSVGPIGDNCFGLLFSIEVSKSANLVFNGDDWNA